MKAGSKSGRTTNRVRHPSTRLALFARDGFRCVYCGASVEDGAVLTVDHVVPDALGGTNVPSNLVTACLKCNSTKRDLPLRRFLAVLRDRGVDTTRMARMVRAAVSRRLNRAMGRKLLAARSGR